MSSNTNIQPTPHGPWDARAWNVDNGEGVDATIHSDDESWPKISIVTPSFNQGKFLEETIRSVLMQGYPNLEYIIIDGGSSDNSVEIIRKYERWISAWVSEPDQGQADAINKGFSRSTGAILGWLNSDDLLYPGSIKRVVEMFSSNDDVDMIYGDVSYGAALGNIEREIHGSQLDFGEMLRTLRVDVPQQGCLWRRSVFEKVGGLNPRWHVVLDQEFFLRVASKCKLLYLHETLGFFRDHELSKSTSQQTRWLTELPAMYTDFFSKENLHENISSLKGETMGVVYITCATIAFRQIGKLASLGYLLKAVSCDPFFMFRRHIRNKLVKLIKVKSKRMRLYEY